MDYDALHERRTEMNLLEEAIEKGLATLWLVDNVPEKRRPELEFEQFTNCKAVGNEYLFFFEGKNENIEIKSVLRRKSMKVSCSWQPNGQAGLNTKQIYTNRQPTTE